MQKNTCLTGYLLVSLIVLSCAGETKKAVAKEAEEKKPAGTKILVCDFEDPEQKIDVYSGPQSKISAGISSEQAKNGKNAAKVEHSTRDWSGAVVVLPVEKRDWAGLSTFRMWVYGSKSNSRLNIDISDGKKEFFRYSYVDDFEGWKELVIPLSEFKSRTDWQPSEAFINKKMDFPIFELHFCTSGFGKGTHYFDDIIIE